MPSGEEHPTCEATTRTGKVCGNRARFVYQVIDGRASYFCGRHVRPLTSSSPHLREIR